MEEQNNSMQTLESPYANTDNAQNAAEAACDAQAQTQEIAQDAARYQHFYEPQNSADRPERKGRGPWG